MASTGEPYGLFWNSENGDRTYDSSSFEYWLKKFFTSGVFNGDLQVIATSSMIVKINPGYANVDGKVKFLDTPLNIVLDASNSTRPRIDTIVITRDNINREIKFEKVTGQYSASEPVPTAPIRNAEIYQLVLAQIYVAAGVTSIIQANISDTRSNPDLCGWITGTVNEMDFSQFAAQFQSYYEDFVDTNQADFESWFQQMQDQLSTDAAGHLQAQINGINENIDNIEEDIDGINDHLTTTDSDIGNLQTDITKKLYQYAHGSSQWDTTPTADSTKPVTSGGIKVQLNLINNEFADINNVLGAKNILPNGASTVTTNGVTFTVNANGTVKATGTATADAILVLASSFYVGNGKKVILNGCPSGGSTSKYYIQMTNANGTTGKGNDVGSGVTITADADNLGCRIIIKKNQALGTTGITFSPMVRPANIRNASYVPYAMVNRELTAAVKSKVDNGVTSSLATDAGWGMIFVNNYLGKMGRLVVLHLAVTRPGGQDMVPNSYSFANVPAGFRIGTAITYVTATLYKSADPNQRRVISAEVRGDGTLHVGYGLDTTGYDSISLSCAYFTNE